MASTGIIQRRYAKHELIANPPLVGEVVFALDTEEFGTLINGDIVWKAFEDIIKSVNGKVGHVVITKEELGLGDVDNTSDMDKPVSTATQSLFNTHTSNTDNPHNVTKETLNLENVDNTSDMDKPVSTATNEELLKKLDKISTAVNSERLGGFLPEYFIKDGTVYSKSETDDMLATKVNLGDVYTKLVLDAMLEDKADKDDTYTKIDSDNKFEVKTNKGVASGYASLDGAGKVPTSQLPSSVTGKSVQTYTDELSLPQPGEADTIYITEDTNSMFSYNVDNNTYENISTSLGETENTAYRGDYGKIAYEHTLNKNNPHEVSASDVNAYNKSEIDSKILNHLNAHNPHEIDAVDVGAYTTEDVDNLINNHTSNTNNPHNVTPEQLNVYEKPVLDAHKNNMNNPHNVTPEQLNVYTKNEVDLKSEYIRTEPTTVTVGGIKKGETFDGTLADVFDRLFYPLTTKEDTPIDINLADEGASIPVSSITQPSNGTASLNNDGTIVTYTPNQDFNGVDSFTYTSENGSTGTISLTVTAVNDITIIHNDTAVMDQDTSINIDVLANDTDVDGTKSSVESVTNGSHGTTSINSDNTITYTPDTGYYGTDSFTYTNVEGNSGVVDITINEVIKESMYYGVWEYNTPPLTIDELNSVDFTKDDTKSSLDGTYTFNAKAYDSEDPDYVEGSNNGNGAYHTFVYPKTWTQIDASTGIVDNSNNQSGGWEYDADITIDGVDYYVLRTSNEQYAGDYTYTVS